MESPDHRSDRGSMLPYRYRSTTIKRPTRLRVPGTSEPISKKLWISFARSRCGALSSPKLAPNREIVGFRLQGSEGPAHRHESATIESFACRHALLVRTRRADRSYLRSQGFAP